MPGPEDRLPEYYDRLYSGKDYGAEVDVLLRLFQDALGRMPKRVLDVGCGTGGHSLRFAERGLSVMGSDIDEAFLRVARRKAAAMPSGDVTFLRGEVECVAEGGFDLIVSLFNVVNYLHSISQLASFFQSIHRRLAVPGLYIFDGWNGLAAIRDAPRKKRTQIQVGQERIVVRTIPCVDLMEQRVSVDNAVHVTEGGGKKCRFSYRYDHTLWTPFEIRNLLAMAGFELQSVCEWMRPAATATPESWKIMYVCLRTE